MEARSGGDGRNGLDGGPRSDAERPHFRRVRTSRGRLSSVLVVEVNRTNIDSIWPFLLIAVKNASFISIDLELSGLGVRRGWNARNVEERYRTIRESAQSRSVLSLGLSTFRLVERRETASKKRIKYKCISFNILCLCSAPFTVEPDGLLFLARHHFDFNRLIQVGVPYYSVATGKDDALKSLWREVLVAGIPLTFHNGLVDVLFLYEHFYCALPPLLDEFVANVADWFPAESPPSTSLVDSKYLAEYVARFSASFLEYVFRKCQRENALEASNSRLYISVEFEDFAAYSSVLAEWTEEMACPLPEFLASRPPRDPSPVCPQLRDHICKKFMWFGFCGLGEKCPLIHDVDVILNMEEEKQQKRRQRRKRRYDFAAKGVRIENDEREEASLQDCAISPPVEDKPTEQPHRTDVSDDSATHIGRCMTSYSTSNAERSVIGCHRAGVDSFMTGFAVAFLSRMSLLRTGHFDPQHCNNVPLAGKSSPLVIRRSAFAARTADHVRRWADIAAQKRTAASTPILGSTTVNDE